MKNILRGLCCAGWLASLALFASAGTMTMKGMISDSMCSASHAKMMAAHPGMTDAQCTQGCVKGGAKYIFVSKGMVYQIVNQDMADVMKEAVESVQLPVTCLCKDCWICYTYES
jgi:hypothetical protein